MRIKAFTGIAALSSILVLLLGSCRGEKKEEQKFLFTILADPAFEPFVRSALETEQVKDTNYLGTLRISPQEEAIKEFLDRKANLLFSGRKLTEEELSFLKSNQKVIRTYEVGWEGIAVIKHKSDRDTTLTLSQLKQAVLNNSGTILLNHAQSSNADFLLSRLKFVNEKAKFVFVGSDSAIVSLVKTKPGYTGIISYSSIADKDDPAVQQILSEVRVVHLSDSSSKPCLPSLDALATGAYPLKRLVYMISSEGVDGLSAGMAGFMLQNKGKRLLLKMGILPYSMPDREVELINKEL